MSFSSIDFQGRWDREKEEREDRMMSNNLYGPHLGQGECLVCQEGRASAEGHCCWCGVNFGTDKAYADHMYGSDTDCFVNMARAVKSVVNKPYPSPVPAERNWQEYLNGLLSSKHWTRSAPKNDFWLAAVLVSERGEDPKPPQADWHQVLADSPRGRENRIARNDGTFR